MKNIYISGFMGTGKTIVSEILANNLGRDFVEMDALIEEREHKRIVEIFEDSGEAYFRKLEQDLLKELSERSGLVVSCGGGLICNDDNIAIMKENGIIFNLNSTAQNIYDRTKQHSHRPLLNVDNPLEQINTLMEKRKPYYDKADYQIKSQEETPEDVADEILGILENNG